MDVLHKLVTFLTNPLTLALAGLFLALIIPRLRWLLLLIPLWLYCWSTPLMTCWLGMPLESPYPPQCAEDFPRADAICLLGGGMDVNTNACVYPEMAANADRVWMAAKLFKANKAPLITISGTNAWISTVPLLADFGVPTNRIVAFESAKNTEDEARQISEHLKAVRATPSPLPTSILLVTSAWHMRRAGWLFERTGLSVVPAPCDYETTTRFAGEPFKLRELLPDAEALFRNSYLWKEHFAYWCYRILK